MSALDKFNEWFGSIPFEEDEIMRWVAVLNEFEQLRTQLKKANEEIDVLSNTLDYRDKHTLPYEQEIEKLVTELKEANEDAERLAEYADHISSRCVSDDSEECECGLYDTLEQHQERMGYEICHTCEEKLIAHKDREMNSQEFEQFVSTVKFETWDFVSKGKGIWKEFDYSERTHVIQGIVTLSDALVKAFEQHQERLKKWSKE